MSLLTRDLPHSEIPPDDLNDPAAGWTQALEGVELQIYYPPGERAYYRWVQSDAPAPEERSPTKGMCIEERILHVGGRNNAAGYVEFGSVHAVLALVRQVLRDRDYDFQRVARVQCAKLAVALGEPGASERLEKILKKYREEEAPPTQNSPIQGFGVDIQALQEDADRYRKLRSLHWKDGKLFVMRGKVPTALLGVDCPSGERLDEALDALLAETGPAK